MWRVAGGEKVIDPKHFSYVFTITTWSSSPSCSNSPTLEDSWKHLLVACSQTSKRDDHFRDSVKNFRIEHKMRRKEETALSSLLLPAGI